MVSWRRVRRWVAVAAIACVALWVIGNAYAAYDVANFGRNAIESRNPASLGLSYESVSYDGTLPAWYIPGSPGEPVIVVVHGFRGNRSSNLAVAASLHDLGYGLLFIDLAYALGRGKYGGGQREAAEVDAAASWVTHHLHEPVVLCGFSAGGLAVLLAGVQGVHP